MTGKLTFKGIVSIALVALLASLARAQAPYYEGKAVTTLSAPKAAALRSPRKSSRTIWESIFPASRR